MFQALNVVRGAVTPTIAFAVLTASSNFIASVGAFGTTRSLRRLSLSAPRIMDRTIRTTSTAMIPTSSHPTNNAETSNACFLSTRPDSTVNDETLSANHDENDNGNQIIACVVWGQWENVDWIIPRVSHPRTSNDLGLRPKSNWLWN
eukprot:scaffold1522_cov39-Attheya_sp.AAC.2